MRPFDWIICESEDNPGGDARPFAYDYARICRDIADKYYIPFFFKQAPDPDTGELLKLPPLDGVQYAEFPTLTVAGDPKNGSQ
jgi:hypothetical protein